MDVTLFAELNLVGTVLGPLMGQAERFVVKSALMVSRQDQKNAMTVTKLIWMDVLLSARLSQVSHA
jgi:hypothetical protein